MSDLASDPSYLAYLRALGFQETTARTNAENQRGQVEDQMAFATPEIQYQGGIDRRNISGGFEDRGLFRSGEHERALAEQSHAQQAQLTGLQLQGTNQIGDIESGLATEIANLRRQQAENALSVAGQQYQTELLRQQGLG